MKTKENHMYINKFIRLLPWIWKWFTKVGNTNVEYKIENTNGRILYHLRIYIIRES